MTPEIRWILLHPCLSLVESGFHINFLEFYERNHFVAFLPTSIGLITKWNLLLGLTGFCHCYDFIFLWSVNAHSEAKFLSSILLLDCLMVKFDQ